jgi:hypothetical protein
MLKRMVASVFAATIQNKKNESRGRQMVPKSFCNSCSSASSSAGLGYFHPYLHAYGSLISQA